jgi:cholesterol oxidase
MSFEAIVVGSGFGGAVAALRLGEAGVRTLVLERGRLWPIRSSQDTFAPSTNPDGRSVWLRTSWGGRPVERYAGVREVVEAQGMTIRQGAGVGGGSLVYAAIIYQPGREMFRRAFGGAVDEAVDYDEMDRVYYPRVRSILQASPVPDDVLAAPCAEGARRFAARAAKAGFVPRRVDLGVDWDVVRDEIAGKKKPSWIVGEFTTNSGAKNTLDRNYLARAEATGLVEIRPLHRVVGIAERAPDGFRVAIERIDDSGTVVSSGTLDCKHLFLAAGSLGTTTLLLRARAKGTLTRLSEHVGSGWGANGDRFVPVDEERRMVAGIAFEHFDNPHGPVVMEDLPDVRFALTLGSVTGTLRYDPARDDVTLDWPSDAPANVEATRATALTSELFETRNGLPRSAPCVTTQTVHPLGGAVLGRVCDAHGRVFGYDGLYVLDGALLPGTSGCANPSLTIAALAERAMERIVFELR